MIYDNLRYILPFVCWKERLQERLYYGSKTNNSTPETWKQSENKHSKASKECREQMAQKVPFEICRKQIFKWLKKRINMTWKMTK